MKLCAIGDTTPLVYPKRYNMIPSDNVIEMITSETFESNFNADIFLIQTVDNLEEIISALIKVVSPHLDLREQDYLDILIFIDSNDEQIDFDSVQNMVKINTESDREQEIENRKDERTKIVGTQQSAIADQKQNNLLPINFENNQDLNI